MPSKLPYNMVTFGTGQNRHKHPSLCAHDSSVFLVSSGAGTSTRLVLNIKGITGLESSGLIRALISNKCQNLRLIRYIPSLLRLYGIAVTMFCACTPALHKSHIHNCLRHPSYRSLLGFIGTIVLIPLHSCLYHHRFQYRRSSRLFE